MRAAIDIENVAAGTLLLSHRCCISQGVCVNALLLAFFKALSKWAEVIWLPAK